MDINALAKEAEAYIIERRRHFHQHPELSFKEWETTKTIVAELEAMGLPAALAAADQVVAQLVFIGIIELHTEVPVGVGALHIHGEVGGFRINRTG